jgi:hypothetical protein
MASVCRPGLLPRSRSHGLLPWARGIDASLIRFNLSSTRIHYCSKRQHQVWSHETAHVRMPICLIFFLRPDAAVVSSFDPLVNPFVDFSKIAARHRVCKPETDLTKRGGVKKTNPVTVVYRD